MKLSKNERKRILAELNEIREILNKQASNKNAKLSSSVSEEDIFRLLKKYGKVQKFFPKSGKFKGSTNFELSVPKYELNISIYITPKGYVAIASDLNGSHEETFRGNLYSVEAFVERSIDIARQAWEENYQRDNFMDSWKQASSGFFKPYPIEYEDESDLNAGIDSVLLDIVDGFGFLNATKVVVKGDTAYVKVEGEIELDVEQLKPTTLVDLITLGDLVTEMPKWDWELFAGEYYGEFAQVGINISLKSKGLVLECFVADPIRLMDEDKNRPLTRKQLDDLRITKVIDIDENPFPILKKMDRDIRKNFKKLVD